MVQLYVKKITSGDINASTGLPWELNDVPKLWREKVRKELEEVNHES